MASQPQTLTWTVLPNGFGTPSPGPRLKFSVFIGPRLTSSEMSPRELQDWPDFLDWPASVAGATFKLKFAGGDEVDATVTSAPSSTLWQLLFSDTTPVKPFQFDDLSGRWFRSYPAADTYRFLKDEYTRIAINHAKEFPSILDLIGSDNSPDHLADIFLEESDVKPLLKERLEEKLLAKKAIGPADFSDPAIWFFQLREFLKPRTQNINPDETLPEPEFDFHEMISSMGDYPEIMRRMGIVLDLEADLPDSFATSPSVVVETSCHIIPSWTPDTSVNSIDASPRTACIVHPDASKFAARPRPVDPDLDNGMLILSDSSKYQVIPIDIDGGAMKAMDLVTNVKRAAFAPTADTPENFSLPALRTGGFSVVRKGLAAEAVKGFEEAAAKNSLLSNPSAIELFAEDLVRGFAVDVHVGPGGNAPGRWHSLCLRRGTYDFLDSSDPALDLNDEGFISLATTEGVGASAANPATGEPDLYSQESLFFWQGWSLAAEPVGKTINPDADQPPLSNGTPVANTSSPFRLQVSFKVPKAPFKTGERELPRLRFGQAYRFRMRAKDLAGNGVPPPGHTDYPADFSDASEEVPFARFEPIPSPAIVYKTEPTFAESLERLVIRSNYNTNADAVSERHIAPPRVGQMMAERLAMFDKSDGTMDRDAYDLIRARESGSFNPVTPQHDAAPDVVFPADTLSFTVENSNKAALPYLPDPLASAACFRAPPEPAPETETIETIRGIPGTPTGELRVSFQNDILGSPLDWPDASAFRIKLTEHGFADHSLVLDPWPGTRELTVLLPKAEVVRVRLGSCLVSTATILSKKPMGPWLWANEGDVPAGFDEEVLAGEHWMITPWRDLLLVHAVRQPLVVPEAVDGVQTERELGQTFASLLTFVELDGKSTDNLTIKARWFEFIDNPEQKAPEILKAKADVVEIPISPQDDSVALEGGILHEFGDTKHRKVDYTFEGTSRFSEYFREERDLTLPDSAPAPAPAPGPTPTATPKALATPVKEPTPTPLPSGTPGLLAPEGLVEDSDIVRTVPPPTGPDPQVRYTRDRDYTINYAAGTIARTSGGAIGSTDTVRVEFIRKPVTRESIVSPVDVPSSARPAAPKVLYVIPTFRWETTDPVDDQFTSERQGGGLRVYLERPWWSSGQGELLGVLLWNRAAAADLPPEAEPYVTRWGQDPLWHGGSAVVTSHEPVTKNFPKGVSPKTGHTLEELPGNNNIIVVGHEVAFDKERGLWYCDIEIDIDAFPSDPQNPSGASGAYFPFVRLALARYQPNSISLPSVHLSPVVLADFAQLAPDRTATIITTTPDKRTVVLSGPTYLFDGPLESRVEVQVEEQLSSGLPETAGGDAWDAIGEPVDMPFVSDFNQPEAAEWRAEDIALPEAPGTRRFRLVIRQFEQFFNRDETNIEERLVYADAVELV